MTPTARADSRRQHALALGSSPAAPAARSRMRKLLRASPRAEASYVRALLAAFAGIHRATLRHVERRIEAPELRQDDERDDPVEEDFLARLLAWVRPRVVSAVDAMAAEVARRGARALTLIGIDPDEAGVLGILSAARETNIRLVERAVRAYADDVRALFSERETFGWRVEELRDRLHERGNVSLSRASLIARDQTLKAHAAISRARFLGAGVTEARWSTSHDERVRRAHVLLDGETYSVLAGISAEQAAESGEDEGAAPGTPVQCRCVPIPVIPDADDPGDLAAE